MSIHTIDRNADGSYSVVTVKEAEGRNDLHWMFIIPPDEFQRLSAKTLAEVCLAALPASEHAEFAVGLKQAIKQRRKARKNR